MLNNGELPVIFYLIFFYCSAVEPESMKQACTNRDVTKISSCWVNTTSRQGIKQLGISFGFIFFLFSYVTSQGPHS